MAGLLDMLRGQPQQAPAQPQGAPAGGILGGIGGGQFGDRLSDMMAGLAMGSNANDSLAKAGMMIAQGNQSRRKNKLGVEQANKTASWLTSQGLGQQEAEYLATDPDALRSWYKEFKTGSQPEWKIQRLFNNEGVEQDFMVDMKNPTRMQPIGGAKSEAPALTTDQKEYQQAKDQGFEGSFMDYQIKMKEAGRNQVNIDTGVKLPSGFRWINPDNQQLGVEPIPGGPGSQIPGELAARIGMADSFLGQFDDVKEKVKEGTITGPLDRLAAGAGRGEGGKTFRQIQSGVDALMRLLTGAGMNQTEATEYAERYLPTYRDNAESAASKLDQLKRELESTKNMAMRGRGGDVTPSPAPMPSADVPLEDLLKKYGG